MKVTLVLLLCLGLYQTIPVVEFRSKSDFASPVISEEHFEEDLEGKSEENEEKSWLARVIPEFEFPDLLKPVQIQIPLIQFPDLPSYSISFAK